MPVPFGQNLVMAIKREKEAYAKKFYELMKVVEDISNARNRDNPKKALTKKGIMELARKTMEKYQDGH